MTSDSDWISIGTNICLSGGAKGADLQFGMCAGSAGHRVFHFVFPSYKSAAPVDETVTLCEDQLLIADPFLARANETLGRKWPARNAFTASLLRRNYYQVCEAQSLYAVAAIDEAGIVTGGTSWAVQMFLDRFEDDIRPAYVYDQEVGGWFQWDCGWEAITAPPVPTGVYAGIGSRALNETGKQAIRDLFGYIKKD
jgi:hypothetical protein